MSKIASGVWNRENVQNLLDTDISAVMEALGILLDRQTSDEQQSEYTKHDNKRGFTAFDARMGTGLAKFARSRGFLSYKQVYVARRMLRKYTGQIADHLNAAGVGQIAQEMGEIVPAEAVKAIPADSRVEEVGCGDFFDFE